MKIFLKSSVPELAPPILLPDGRTLAVMIRRSDRARRMALRVPADGEPAELVLPRRASLRAGLAFLEAQRGWVVARAVRQPLRVAFAEGAEVPVLGLPHRLASVGPGGGGRAVFAIRDGRIEVTGGPEQLAGRTRRGLVAHARALLVEKTLDRAERIGRRVTGVAIGDARTRWGSCSAGGRLSFSWRLVLAPERIMDYVAAHEVAHLAEMNHSPRFWRVVASLHPGWEEDRRWLKRHGARLLAYG